MSQYDPSGGYGGGIFGGGVVSIHLVRGGRIACMPGLHDLQRLPQHTLQRTDDLRAVTCPQCIKAAEGQPKPTYGQ